MSPLIWLLLLLVSILAAFFASLLTHALASGAGAALVVGIVGGVGWYLFGPRPHRKSGADHAPSA